MNKLDKVADKSIFRKKGFVESDESIKFIDGFPVFTIVEFNIYGACNRSCSFCPVSDASFYTNKYEGIALDLHTKIMKDLEKIKYDGALYFSAFSEPFLNKELPELVKISRSILPEARIEINTNGDIFKERTEKLMKLFDAGLNTVSISVYDGPTAYDEFSKMRETLNLTESQCILRRRYFDEKAGDWGTVFSNRAGLANTKTFLDETRNYEEALPLKKHCYYPFYQTLIDYNGDMILCPHDWGKEYIVGNLAKENIWDLWICKKYQVARKLLSQKNRSFKPCNKCDVRGDLIGGPNFKAWIKQSEASNSVSIQGPNGQNLSGHFERAK